MNRRTAALLLLATPALAEDPARPDAPKPEAPAPFRGTAEELDLARPEVSIRTIGTSRGGRPVRALDVRSGSADDVRWTALVVAGLDGRRDADESSLALAVAARLAEKAASLPKDVSFRFLLDGNPDASAARSAWPRAGNDTATDDDQDGVSGEDAPDDLDGDGRISWMRVPDPAGDLSVDPKSDDAPLRADPAKGRLATHRLVPEGRDDDRDGLFNEDGPGGVNLARNFTVGFEEHVPACGRWAASEPETRAILDHLLADERIAVVLELGDSETLAAAADGPWAKVPDEDGKLYAGLREALPKIEGDKRAARAPGPGSLGAAALHQLGRVWLGRAPGGRVGPQWPGGDAAWPAHLAVRWRPVSGAGAPPGAELATIVPVDAAKSVPAPDVVALETPGLAALLTALADGRAKLSFTRTETTGEAGVARISLRLVNTGRLPTHTARGAETKARRPLNLRVELPQGATLLAGAPAPQIERLAAGAESDELKWVVAGPSGAAVRIVCTGPDTGEVVHEARIP